MAIRDEVLKELLEGYKKPEDLLGPEGLLKQLTAALVPAARGDPTGHREREDLRGRAGDLDSRETRAGGGSRKTQSAGNAFSSTL